jgi:hypothetical protein
MEIQSLAWDTTQECGCVKQLNWILTLLLLINWSPTACVNKPSKLADLISLKKNANISIDSSTAELVNVHSWFKTITLKTNNDILLFLYQNQHCISGEILLLWIRNHGVQYFKTHFIVFVSNKMMYWKNHMSDIMVSMITSSVIDRGFDPLFGQTKDYKNNCFLLLRCLTHNIKKKEQILVCSESG